MSEEIKLKVNGTYRKIPIGANVKDLLNRVGIASDQKGIAVAVNDEVVRRDEWPHRILNPDDEIDVIHATQGG